MADELDMIVISSGEISSGEIFGYGDTITVKSGGTLDDAYIPADAQSLTLEAGAILTNSITIGVNTLVQGWRQPAQHLRYHLWLDPQKQPITAGGKCLVVGGVTAEFGGERFGFFCQTVR